LTNKFNLAKVKSMEQQPNKKLSEPKSPLPKIEEEVLSFWNKNKIFEKSITSPPTPLLNKERVPKAGEVKDYVFYDGPPFATGTPHYGHIVASIMKDIVPRYWTMKGYRVERKWGWDCHGLPIENIVEKELGFKSKKDIAKLGVANFNEACRSKVLAYVDEWQKVISRLGRWADMENAYKTMDKDYMESIWWVFKQLWDKCLIYEGYRSMHICPRCETTLSQQEVAEGYKDVKDLSATVKFELIDDPGTYVLAWTTTPWTLIGNVALAVNEKETYVKLKITKINHSHKINAKEGEVYILLESAISRIFGTPLGWSEMSGLIGSALISNKDFSAEVDVLERPMKIKNLIGKKYKPLFDYYAKDEKLENKQNGWKIYSADFVTTEEGTGVVHIAPAFGEDDMNLAKTENLPFIQHVNMDGTFKEEVTDFTGLHVKPIEDTQATDVEIIKYLAHKNLLFSKEKYEHSYPHCWRCDTPLLNYAAHSWFVDVTRIKNDALKLAKEIKWTPKHIKEGRFGQWLEGARDWSISRQRFWASVIPIWRCTNEIEGKSGAKQRCGNTKIFGSIKELEELSGQKVDDLHKHIVDEITFKCEKCGGLMKRVQDVLDTWFDSGSMPYAQMHYPFENEKKFENNFPAAFIAEGVDQTRAWFYYLHVIATAIRKKPAFKNVIVNGIVLAEDGKKMSKRLQNYPDPMDVMNKYGADPLRYYLCASPVMKAESINFSEKDLVEQTRFFNILLNVLSFYKMFACPSGRRAADMEVENLAEKDLVNVLDKWITARLEETKKTVTKKMDDYDLHAIRELPVFINDLSTWYVRRSRARFKGDDEADKMRALKTLRRTLYHLARIMAPFLPFTAEHIYQELGADIESVHLKAWPEVRKEWIAKDVLQNMEQARKIVGLGLAKRDEAGIKVRQPLNQFSIFNFQFSMNEREYIQVVKDELNVKEVVCKKGKGELVVELDTNITSELKLEGIKRELVRAINNLRKEAGMAIQDRAIIYYQTDSKDIKEVFAKFGEEIKKDALADDLQVGSGGEEVGINGEKVELKVEKK